MKSRILPALALLLLVALHRPAPAQIVHYFEGFEADFPANMIRIDNDHLLYQGTNNYPDGWKAQNRQKPFVLFSGQGTISPAATKLKFQTGDSVCGSTSAYDPAGTSDDWLITPQITVPANGWFCFDEVGTNSSSWLVFSYDHLQVRISTTGNAISDFTTVLYTDWASAYWKTHCLDLSAYVGQNVYIAIVNNTYDNYFINVDNLQVVSLLSYDVSASPYFPTTWSAVGRQTHPRVVLTNHSNQTINSLSVKWSTGTNVYSQDLTGLNFAPHDVMDTTLTAWWVPSAAGTYTVKMWATALNGNADQLHDNDTATVQVEVYPVATERKTLIETSSGADCWPCAHLAVAIKPFYDGWQTNSRYGDVTALEYQTYYQDPSRNPEAEARTWRYNVQGFPDESFNGIPDYIGNYCADDKYRRLYRYQDTWFSNQPAFMDIDVDLAINGNTATVTATLHPLVDFPSNNLRLFIAIAEKEYTYTGGFTTQTDFIHVFRKFMPDANGIPIGPLTANTPLTHTESYTFTIGNVAIGNYNLWVGMNNIEAVVFVQDDITDEIHQSAAVYASDPFVGLQDAGSAFGNLALYPNPATNWVTVEWESQASGPWSVSIMGNTGRKLMERDLGMVAAGQQRIQLELNRLAKGIYFVQVETQTGRMIKKLVVN